MFTKRAAAKANAAATIDVASRIEPFLRRPFAVVVADKAEPPADAEA